jgi:hypothetical protein
MASPAFVNKVESNSGGTAATTFAATLPGSLVVGNTLILAAIFFISGGGPSPTIASGWTTLYSSGPWGFGNYSKMTVFSRLIDGTEGASVVVGNSSAAAGNYAVGVAQYSGVASPARDGTAQAGASNLGTTTPSPAITTTAANDMVLCFCTGGETVGYTLDTPGNVQRMNPANSGVPFEVTMCEVPKAAAGTLAAGTWTRGGSGQGFIGHTLALLAVVTTPGSGKQQYKNPQTAGIDMRTMQYSSHASLANGCPVGGAAEGTLTATGSPAGVLGTGANADLWTPSAEAV